MVEDLSHAANQADSRSGHLAEFANKMLAAGQPDLVVKLFARHYEQLLAGATGYIDQSEALPVPSLPDYESLEDHYSVAGSQALTRVAVAKLNGGLGTGMGMSGPKSLLPVKDGLTFLDVIIRQIIYARRQTGYRIPLLLMNSFSTHAATLNALQQYADFEQDVPIDFLQHMKPKIWVDTLAPASWPADPEKEWCPSGHGDIYVSLVTSGVLTALLEAGYEFLFVSNSDNLGAVLDTKILGYMASEEIPFLMEVADRTAADSKGGHLSIRPDGQLILREISQCPPQEHDRFQDINRYRYFNTNNLWLHLPTIRRLMHEQGDILELPLIRNEKPIDPSVSNSPHVYQLETAMGSAIALFEAAQAIRVPRDRFVPVKRNSDLLVLWSDVYELTDGYQLAVNPNRKSSCRDQPPLVYLDPRYYQMIDDVKRRFPHGAPSLCKCSNLHIEGDIHFGRNVVAEGDVRIVNSSASPHYIEDDTVLRGE
jgi:UTP--glucose-1-phosphate uridylyltransferase